MNIPKLQWDANPAVIDDIVHELETSPESALVVKDGEEDVEYTPNELIQHLYAGTELGRELYDTHLTLRAIEEQQ